MPNQTTTAALVARARKLAVPLTCGVEFDDLPPAGQALVLETAKEWTADLDEARVYRTRAEARAAYPCMFARRDLRKVAGIGWVFQNSRRCYRV